MKYVKFKPYFWNTCLTNYDDTLIPLHFVQLIKHKIGGRFVVKIFRDVLYVERKYKRPFKNILNKLKNRAHNSLRYYEYNTEDRNF